MASLEESMIKQRQIMGSISRALSNFKKLGQAKMTRAVVQSRITSLKEKFTQSQDLDARIRTSVDVKMAENLSYFSNNEFRVCEDQYEEALDYLHEVLSLVTGDSGGDMNSGCITYALVYRAKQALNILAITEANFTVAWDLITSRYENKHRLISGHLQTLFSLPQVSSETSNDLRGLRDKANTTSQALKNLDRPVDAWSDILVFLVSQKLDKSSRKAWELQLGDTVDYPYTELDKFLKSRIRAFETISLLKSGKSDAFQKSSKSKSIAAHSDNLDSYVLAMQSIYCINVVVSIVPSLYTIAAIQLCKTRASVH